MKISIADFYCKTCKMPAVRDQAGQCEHCRNRVAVQQRTNNRWWRRLREWRKRAA